MYENLTAQERKSALQSLVDSVGWKILAEVLEGAAKTRQDHILLTPTHELQGQYIELEFVKGEISGLRTALVLVDAMLQAAIEDAATEIKEEEDEQSDLDDSHPDTSNDPDPADWDG